MKMRGKMEGNKEARSEKRMKCVQEKEHEVNGRQREKKRKIKPETHDAKEGREAKRKTGVKTANNKMKSSINTNKPTLRVKFVQLLKTNSHFSLRSQLPCLVSLNLLFLLKQDQELSRWLSGCRKERVRCLQNTRYLVTSVYLCSSNPMKNQ